HCSVPYCMKSSPRWKTTRRTTKLSRGGRAEGQETPPDQHRGRRRLQRLVRFPSSRWLAHWARNWRQRLSHPWVSGVDARLVSGAASVSAPPVGSTGLGGDFRPIRLVTTASSWLAGAAVDPVGTAGALCRLP